MFFGFVWRGEIFAVLAEVQEDITVLAIEGDYITADQFNASNVVTFGGLGGVEGLFLRLALRLAGEGLPSEDEVEVWIVRVLRLGVAKVRFLNGYLGVDEGGFESDEAGLTPVDGG